MGQHLNSLELEVLEDKHSAQQLLGKKTISPTYYLFLSFKNPSRKDWWDLASQTSKVHGTKYHHHKWSL